MDLTSYTTAQQCDEKIAELRSGLVAIPSGNSIYNVIMESIQELEVHRNMLLLQVDPEYIYHTLQANAKFPVTQDKKDCIENTVNALLEDTAEATKPVLLLGKVQCGKTDTFENIVGLSFDRGIDICIVMTKGTKPLATQTLERLRDDFKYFEDKHRDDQPKVVYIYDIIEDLKREGIPNKIANKKGAKIIIVCKKEDDNLKHLISLFAERSKFLQHKKVLVVDDEADFASNNYRKSKGELKLAVITELINTFISIPLYCRYLQVTATPYSLFLLPDFTIQINSSGDIAPVFRPRHTELVPIHDKYIGGQQYYEDSKDPDSMYSYLFHPVSQKCVDVMGHRNAHYLNKGIASSNIQDLTYAVVAYFMAAAIRSIQEQVNHVEYLTSGLIHTETLQKHQKWQCELILKLIADVKNGFLINDFGQEDLRVKNYIDSIYKDYCDSTQAGIANGMLDANLLFPSKEEVITKVKKIFDENDYVIRIVNGDNEVKALLDKDGQLRLTETVNIFIGGNILDRGITINNMLCFFYGRDPKEMKMDTVIQHARMYGARSKEDMAVMRFHTTNELYGQLEKINALDEELRLRLIDQHDNPNDSIDFDTQLVGYDKGIKPCAAQKIRISDIKVMKPHKRMLPVGFQTGYKSNISKIIEKIDELINATPGHTERDFFLMDKEKAYEILRLIRQTYVYGETSCQNEGLDWNIEEYIGLIEYAMLFAQGQQIYIHHRTGRDMSRFRENGGFIDAPDDGRKDTRPCRDQAQDIPVLMLLKENGDKDKGWRDTPFYWPVFIPQSNVSKGMYALNGKVTDIKTVTVDCSHLIDGIDPEQILYLTINSGNFMKILTYEQQIEVREVLESTASRYLCPSDSENVPFALRTDVAVDPKKAGHVHAFNEGEFPFEVKQFRYILFRDSRDKSGSVMLVELLNMMPVEYNYERIKDTDILIDKHLNTEDYEDKNLALWKLIFNISEVKGYVLNSIDQRLYDEEMEARRQINTVPDSPLYYANGRYFLNRNPYGVDPFAPADGIHFDDCICLAFDDGGHAGGCILTMGDKRGLYLIDYCFGQQGSRYCSTEKEPFGYDTIYYNSANPHKSLVYVAVEKDGLWGIIKADRSRCCWVVPIDKKSFDEAKQALEACESEYRPVRGWCLRDSWAADGMDYTTNL